MVHKYRFVAVSLTPNGLKEYVDNHKMTFPVCTDLPQNIAAAYKIGGTPQTIVVSPGGKVLKNWQGAYMDQVKKDVESFFSIALNDVK